MPTIINGNFQFTRNLGKKKIQMYSFPISQQSMPLYLKIFLNKKLKYGLKWLTLNVLYN